MPYKTRWNRPEECDHERRPLDVDELFDQLERELGFAEEGTNWYNFLDSLRNDVLAWLDTPEEERNG